MKSRIQPEKKELERFHALVHVAGGVPSLITRQHPQGFVIEEFRFDFDECREQLVKLPMGWQPLIECGNYATRLQHLPTLSNVNWIGISHDGALWLVDENTKEPCYLNSSPQVFELFVQIFALLFSTLDDQSQFLNEVTAVYKKIEQMDSNCIQYESSYWGDKIGDLLQGIG